MKKMKLIIWAFMLSLILPFQALAIDENWILVEEGSSIIKFSKAEIFENNLKQKVSKLQQDSLESGEKYIFRYNLDIVKNEKTEEDTTTKKDIKKIDVEQEFYTVKDAEDYYNEIELQAPLHKGEFSIKPLKRSKTVKGEEKEFVCGSNDCSDVINRLKLEESISKKLVYDIYHVEEILGEEKEVYYFENNMLKLFDTKKEAEEFASEYVPYEQGFKFIGNDVVETVVTTEQEEYITETYKTESEAQAALDNLKSEYTIKSSSITPIRNMEKDTSNDWTLEESYYTEEEAIEKAKQLDEKTSEYEQSAEVRKSINSVDYKAIEDVITNQFDNEQDALNAIEELKSQGYKIDNYEILTIPYEEIKWEDQEHTEIDPLNPSTQTFKYRHLDIVVLDSFDYYNQDGSVTKVNGELKINNVKVDNKTINMRKTTDPSRKDIEYASVSRNLTITNNSKVEINGTIKFTQNGIEKELPFSISGYLSEDQNKCKGIGKSKGFDLKFDSVKIINEKVKIDVNISNKYKLIGNMHKEEVKYYVDVNKLNYGFDYKLEVNLQKEIIEEKYKIKSKFKKIEQQESHKIKYRFDLIEEEEYYLLSYETFTYDLIEYADANYIIEKLELDVGGGNEDIKDDQQDEILPPNTGVEVKQKHSMMYILFILSALLISKKFLEEKLSK